MQFDPELDALGRIVISIKTYRHQTADYRVPATNRQMDAYLKKHLSIQDWVFWQRLQVSQLTGRNAGQRAAA